MAGKDFFDDDLVRQRERGGRIDANEPAVPLSEGGSINAPPRQVADLNLTRMARHRKEVDEQAAQALQELEKLRKRQDHLESEKRHLEEMRRRHDDYDRGRREMSDHLRRSLSVLERQEADAQRMVELYNVTRHRFRELLGAIESINDDEWAEDQIRNELNNAIALIEEARTEYNKSMARIEAARGEGGTEPAQGKSAVLFEDMPASHEEKGFGYWVKIGLAVSIPIIITLVIAFAVFMTGRLTGWF